MKVTDNNQLAKGMSGDEHKNPQNNDGGFITETKDKKLRFSSSEFFRFLHMKGVRKTKQGSDFELVMVKDYIVSRITCSEVKELVLQHVKTLENDRFMDYILNKTVLFSIKYLDAVETIALKMHRDIPGESFFYFLNGVVRVTACGINPPVPYKEFKRFIWKDHIISRNFNPNVDTGLTPPMFQDFISKLSDNNVDHFKQLCSVIGYCLYDYKTSATSRAVIINDQKVSSVPEGGSGKSLIVDAISKLRKTVFYDGKRFDPKANFIWQKIDETVRIVSIDDVKLGFNFQDLFSIITSGFRNINKKNKDEIELSVEESPKIVITTNNILKGNSGSFFRRQYQVDVFQFFNHKLTPIDFYKTTFFSDWDNDEWSRFDVFMLECVVFFLKFGVTSCNEMDKEYKELIRATNQSFADWIEDNLYQLTAPEGISTINARDYFLSDTNQRMVSFSDRKFTTYIKSYCEIYGHRYEALQNFRPRRFRIVCDE